MGSSAWGRALPLGPERPSEPHPWTSWAPEPPHSCPSDLGADKDEFRVLLHEPHGCHPAPRTFSHCLFEGPKPGWTETRMESGRRVSQPPAPHRALASPLHPHAQTGPGPGPQRIILALLPFQALFPAKLWPSLQTVPEGESSAGGAQLPAHFHRSGSGGPRPWNSPLPGGFHIPREDPVGGGGANPPLQAHRWTP